MGILEHLSNAPDIGATGAYAAILGANPSQGARSPKLWNAVLERVGKDARFHPFDVTSQALAPLVRTLESDRNFLGGAVAVPHKGAIAVLLREVEPIAKRIGAVNALYRMDGVLVGANTDGLAAIAALRQKLGVERLQSLDVLLVGTGGAGAAVAAYVADDLGPKGRLRLANRDRAKADALMQRLGGKTSSVEWPPARSTLETVDVLINCSAAGFVPGGDVDAIPARYLTAMSGETTPAENIRDTVALLRALPPSALVFDVVYQPRQTMLLILAAGLGLATLGGLSMNLEQAVLAFHKAIPDVALGTVRSVMSGVA